MFNLNYFQERKLVLSQEHEKLSKQVKDLNERLKGYEQTMLKISGAYLELDEMHSKLPVEIEAVAEPVIEEAIETIVEEVSPA